MKSLKFFLLVISIIFFSSQSCLAEDNIVIKWNKSALKAVEASSFGPTVIARALAIVHTCIYDAWAAYDTKAVGTRLEGTLRRPQEEHTQSNKEKAISYAAYNSLVDLFPDQKNIFDDLMEELNYDTNDTSTDINTPSGIGNVVSNEVISFRTTDNSNQEGNYADTISYMAVNTSSEIINVNHWQPLLENGMDQNYLTPHWKNLTPFALSSNSQFRPPVPPLFPSKRFFKEVKEIVKLSGMLTDEQKIIAEYWIDGEFRDTATGHLSVFAQFISNRDSHTLDDDVKLFFILNNALLDSSIAVWEGKYVYDYTRPISAIREVYKGKKILAWKGNPVVQSKEAVNTTLPQNSNTGGNATINGEDWQPFLLTPPFPEYVSGHSAFGAAAAEVFRLFTGSDDFGFSYTAKPGSSYTEPGITPKKELTLYYPTFTKAQKHDGLSRLYGGIHFRSGYAKAQTLGEEVGRLVFDKCNQYFNGTITNQN